jgi:hypothetical protein
VLGELVDAAAGAHAAACDRADVDEVGHAAGLALGGTQEVRERGVGDVEQPLEVDLDHPVPLLDRGVDDRAEQHHPGVVDDDVEPAELLHRALDGSLRLLAVRHIRLDRQAADLGRERVQPVFAASHGGHRRAMGGEHPGRRLTDAAACARDERDRVSEFVAHAVEV